MASIQSPDPDSIFRFYVKPIGGFDVEGLIPRVKIAHHAIYSEWPMGMLVAHSSLSDVVFRRLATIILSPRAEEALVTGKSIDYRCWRAVQ
jgi:hypothetical protein